MDIFPVKSKFLQYAKEVNDDLISRKYLFEHDHYFHGKINVFTKEVTKELISRKIFKSDRVLQYFSILWGKIKLPHCAVWKLRNFTAILQNFRQINVLLKNFAIN